MSLRVRCTTGPSPIHGTGLFALDAVAAGAVVWAFDPAVDRVQHHAPCGCLRDWAWRERDGAWVLPGDDARYMNHSARPNVRSGGGRARPDTAARIIAAGEELTIDYAVFDVEFPAYADALRGAP